MSYAHSVADSLMVKPDNSTSDDMNEKKSFAKEIAEKNKEIREQHRIIIQESIEQQPPTDSKRTKKKRP